MPHTVKGQKPAKGEGPTTTPGTKQGQEKATKANKKEGKLTTVSTHAPTNEFVQHVGENVKHSKIGEKNKEETQQMTALHPQEKHGEPGQHWNHNGTSKQSRKHEYELNTVGQATTKKATPDGDRHNNIGPERHHN
eukprot:9877830-Prorocentrum_lima.AAC.1